MKLRLLALAAALLAPVATSLPAFAQTSDYNTDSTWWKHAVIYEIYPRSFADTNGDALAI